MRFPVMVALLCLVFSSSALPSEPLTQSQVIDSALELIQEVGSYTRESSSAPGAFPLWAVEMVEVGDPLLVHRYPELDPSYFIVPVLGGEALPTSFVTFDASTGEWHAYWGAGVVLAFPGVSRARAAEVASREVGRECAPGELRAVSMPNKQLYWHAAADAGHPEVFIGLADPADVHIGLDVELTPSLELEPPPDTEPDRAPLDRVRPAGRYPPSYDIADVPHYYQATNYNCGPAALEMVFDYCGPHVNQTDIAHAANTNSAIGTYALDLRRAAHFSSLSTSVQWPYIQGYAERSLGYAAAENKWVDGGLDYPDRYNDLKNLISTDWPILVLTYYDENHGPLGPNHFRVVKGYDDSTNVFIVHDPWDPNLGAGAYWGPNVHFNQVFFVDDLWRTYDRWGMFTAPWNLECTAPSSLLTGVEFTVTAAVFYPGPHPFEGDYAATSPTAEIVLPPGFSLLVGETAVKALSGIVATGTADTVSWQVYAPCDPGSVTITVRATGRVSGGCPSYPSGYTDDIGGEEETGVELASRVFYVDVNGTGDFLTIWEGIDATRCDGDSVIVLPGTYIGNSNKELDTDGLNIVFRGRGGAENVIIDCEGAGRGFFFGNGEDTTLVVSGFTIRNGDVSQPDSGFRAAERQLERVGGGIQCFESTPTLRDLIVEGCTAEYGAGIAWVGSLPNIENARITGNTALMVTDRQFSGHGGGAYVGPEEQWKVARAPSGYDTIGRFRNVEFVGNTAGVSGGGLYAAEFDGNLWDVTFQGNSAATGGGMHMDACAPRLERTLFARNIAGRAAAILFEGQSFPWIGRTTIAYNDCDPEWSAVEYDTSGGSISQTIISHTIDGAAMMCTNGGEPYGGYLNVYANAGGDSICVEQWKRSQNMSYDPLYCDAAANDFTLYDDSRCLPAYNPWGVIIGRYDAGGCGQSDIEELPESSRVFALHCPAPNPVTGAAEIRYEVPAWEGDLTVAVYNLRGQLVRVLFDGPVSVRSGRVMWDGSDEAGRQVASGVYFVRASVGSEQETKKIAILR